MPSVAPAIIVVSSKAGDGAYYEAKWRGRDGRQLKRRIGPAWVERVPRSGEWRKRRGRTPPGWLDARTVHVAAADLVERVEREQAEVAAGLARAEAVTFRRVAREWRCRVARSRAARRRRCAITSRCCASRASRTGAGAERRAGES